MRAWARRLSPPLSMLAQLIVRYPPRTMAKRRRQVPMVELLVRFLAIFEHRLRSPMQFFTPLGTACWENRPPHDAIAHHRHRNDGSQR